jgi:hypothetical protein
MFNGIFTGIFIFACMIFFVALSTVLSYILSKNPFVYMVVMLSLMTWKSFNPPKIIVELIVFWMTIAFCVYRCSLCFCEEEIKWIYIPHINATHQK